MIEEIVKYIEKKYCLEVEKWSRPGTYIIYKNNDLEQVSDRILELSVYGKAQTSIRKVFDTFDYNSHEKLAEDIVKYIDLISSEEIPNLLPICTILMQKLDNFSNPIDDPSIQWIFKDESDGIQITIYNCELACTVNFNSESNIMQILVSLGKVDRAVFHNYYTIGSYSTKIYSDSYQEGLTLAQNVLSKLTYWVNPGRTDINVSDRDVINYCRRCRTDGEYKDPLFKDVPSYTRSMKVTSRPYTYHYGQINKQDEYIVLEDLTNSKYKAFRDILGNTIILLNNVDEVDSILCKGTIVCVYNELRELETKAKVSDCSLADRIILVESQIQVNSSTKFMAKTRYLVYLTERIKFTIDYVVSWNKGGTRSYCVVDGKESLVLPINELIKYQLLNTSDLGISISNIIPSL